MPEAVNKTEQGVKQTREAWFTRIARLFDRGVVEEQVWEELEELLILADVGVETTSKLLGGVRQRVKQDRLPGAPQVKAALKAAMIDLLDVSPPRPFASAQGDKTGRHSEGEEQPKNLVQGNKTGRHSEGEEQPKNLVQGKPGEESPEVILVVGVNGSGKTTSIAKLAYSLTSQGKKVVLAAGDTFRAAAIDQLEYWGREAGAEVVAHQPGSDPGAVVFDAVQAAHRRHARAVIIDTAGRLHTKFNLMEELKKLRKVAGKLDPTAPHQVLLVLDATTGQNGLTQAKYFTQAIGVTGIFLAKLDGTAKGGIVFAICHELNIPIVYIGTGEKLADIAPFRAETFVNAIL